MTAFFKKLFVATLRPTERELLEADAAWWKDCSDYWQDECKKADDVIKQSQLAGWAVWNNVLEGDIEAHTEQASNALQMLREALAKARS